MRFISLRSLTVVLLMLSFSTTCFSDPVPNRVVAYTRGTAPDTGGAWFDLLYAPAINARGTVVFRGRYVGFGIPSNEGIFIERNGVLEPYLLKGDPSPIDPHSFGPFGDPNINDAGADGQGHLVFRSQLTGTSDQVLWLQKLDNHLDYASDSLVDVVHTNALAPGTAGEHFFQINFGSAGEHFLINDNGQTAFEASLEFDGQANRRGIWYYDGTQVNLVALTGDPAPGLADTTFTSVSYPRLNASNSLYFHTGLTQPEFTTFGAIWNSAGGGTPEPTVVQIKDASPAFATGTELSGNTPLSVSSSGQLAYTASFDASPSSDFGISLRPGAGGFLKKSRDGVNTLGGHLLLLNNSEVVFTGNNVDPYYRGVFRTFGAVAPIAREGDPAPGLTAGILLSTLESVTANRAARLAIQTRLTGDGVTGLNDRALYCAGLDGKMDLIGREGDELTLDIADNPDDSTVVTLSSITLIPIGQTGTNGMDGRRRQMSESGQVLWNANFKFLSPASLVGFSGQAVMLSDCGPPSANHLKVPNGTLRGHVDSEAPVETNTGLKVEKATITLIPQRRWIRNQNGEETDKEYREYVAEQLRADTRTAHMDVPDRGKFLFSGLPLVEPVSNGSTRINMPLYYTVRVSKAESEEIDAGALDGSTYTLNFTGAETHNLLAKFENPPDNEFLLDPLDVIARKEALVDGLTTLGPNHYLVVEGQVQAFLNSIKDDPTPAQIEAVRRAELAEHLVRSGFQFADSLLGTMLDGIVALLHDVIDGLSNGNKKLAEQRKKYGELRDKLDLEQLKGRGFLDFNPGDPALKSALDAQMKEMLEGNSDLSKSLFADLIKKGGNAMYALVNWALGKVGMDKGPASEIASSVKLMFDTAVAGAVTQGVAGVGKPIIKALVAHIVKSSKDGLLDSPVSYAYTAWSKDSLEASRQLMEGWNTDDNDAFLEDRRDFNLVENEMGHTALVVAGTFTAYSTAISDAFGGVGADVIELLGPYGRATKKVMDVVKYVSNAVTIGMPFVTVYGAIAGPDQKITLTLPGWSNPLGLEATVEYQLGHLDRGVKAAFGTNTLPAQFELASSNAATAPTAKQIATNQLTAAAVLDAVSDAAAQLDTILADLETALENDMITDASELTSDPGGSSLLAAYEHFRQAVSEVIFSLQGTALADPAEMMTFEELVDAEVVLRLAFSDVLEELEALFLDVMLLTYSGPADPLYVAEREHLLSLLANFRSSVSALDALANPAPTALNEDSQPTVSELLADAATPAIVISDLTLTSDSSGESFISETPEDFTLSMKVRNIGTTQATGVSAMLTVTSVDNSITLDQAAELLVGSGTLAANDATPGGPDEADVEWTFNYDGDPTTEEYIMLLVDLLQDGGPPQDFRPFGNAAILQPDVELFDADLDGMPDAWESDNGLNPATDDSEDDADNDGISNFRELDMGTDPQMKDSDGDNLEDGEEIILGADGFVTNPANADTDDDGAEDDVDGHPLDAGSTAAPDPADLPGEPMVNLSELSVVLSQDSMSAVVNVTNAGTGILNWTVVSDNEAIAVTSPVAPAIAGGEGSLQISVAPTYDFGTPGNVSTIVRVFDIGGDERDYQEINVTVGVILPEEVFVDGFED